MRVGVIGSGVVAQSLGAGFLKHGHELMLGTRDAGKLAGWRSQHPGVRIGSVADTARFGELVVLAVKGTTALDALRTAGARS
jgi:3-hydroxyisobutyrate dehydrogenase-like beta-hydroxyacid dehydrogenase